MNYKQKLAGLNRVKWDNKNTTQKQNILKSHYKSLGYSVPKYLDSNSLTTKQLSQALGKITRGYKSRANNVAKPKYNPQLNYDNTVKKYNQNIEGLGNKLKQNGYSELEIKYLKGEELFLSEIRKKSFHSDLIDLKKIKNQQFQTKKDIINETKRLKQKMKELDKNIENGTLYDNKNNVKSFNEMLNNSAFDDFSESDLEYINQHFNALTPFEREIFMKTRLNELREKYKFLFEEGNEEKASEELFNAILHGIRNTYRAINGNDLLIGKKGTRY